MNEQERLQVVELMQKDIEFMNKKRPGWSDKPVIEKDASITLTPNQVVQEVKDGTEFGVSYAQVWMDFYTLRASGGLTIGDFIDHPEEVSSSDVSLN